MKLSNVIILKTNTQTWENKPYGVIPLRKIWFTDEGWAYLKKTIKFPDELHGQFNGKSTTIDFYAFGITLKTADFDPEKDEPMKLDVGFKKE